MTPKLVQAGEFFVVGGPVQPDRACYVERLADQELLNSIADRQFSYLLSPRASGKSSLMARTIRSLRQHRELAAVVDLAQIGARGESEDPGRWYYSIAYRILRDLRLKVDLQTWWQDKSALLSEQRLVEFFWEIVLTNTTAPVTIFFDEAERAVDIPFAADLFSALRSCYARRTSEPDFVRLNFVVLAVATASDLSPDPSLSPFIDGRPIVLEDFDIDECAQLAAGLDLDEASGRALMERVFHWAHGQPYLTQKITRAVARKGSKLGDVERVVNELFLAPSASQEEPLLNHIRTLLTSSKPNARRALTLLGKVSRDTEVLAIKESASQDILNLSGVVRVDVNGQLSFRNRIYKQVFDKRWSRSVQPVNWRRSAALAATLATIVLIPLWYIQVLPRPYLSTLSVVTQDYAIAVDAYRRLGRLPGFAATADRMFAEAMARRSESADTISEVMAADDVLRGLLDQPDLADELLGSYWLRRSRDASHAEQRDAALLFAMQARAGQQEAVRGVAAELVGSDYRQLQASFRLPEAPLNWEIDWERDDLVVIDQTHRAQRISLNDKLIASAPVSTAAGARIPDRLTALQQVPVTRELAVAEQGSAGAFNLLLTLQHARASDLLVTLTAPSGAQATLPVPQPRADQQAFRFSARADTPLAELAEQEREGLWRLTVVDRRTSNEGVLLDWGLQFSFDRDPWQDEPEQGIVLPDPVRTEQVEIVLGNHGRVALALPTRLGAAGGLAVWDLEQGELRADLPIPSSVEHLVTNADATRVLAITGSVLTLWNVENQRPIATLQTRNEFVLPPSLSVDGAIVAIAEQSDFVSPVFSLLSMEDGELLGSASGSAGISDWALGPDASYLALLNAARQVRVIDPRSGRTIYELRHQTGIERIIPLADKNLLLTVDVRGEISAWPMTLDDSALAPSVSTHLGTTIDAYSVRVSDNADVLTFESSAGEVEVRHLLAQYQAHTLRLGAVDPIVNTRISPDSSRMLTANGSLFRLWQLDRWSVGPRRDLQLSALALDGDGQTSVLGFRGGHVRRLNLGLPQDSAALDTSVDFIGHRAAVTSLAVNATRNIMVSGGEEGVVRVWDLASAAPSQHFMRHPAGPIRAVEISPDGALVASAAEYSARVWQANSGELLGEIPVNGTALAVAFSAAAELLAVGDSAGNVFYGVPRGSEPLLSVRTPAAVGAAAFSPDVRMMATGNDDGAVQIWDVESATELMAPHTFTASVSWLQFSPDGKFLLVHSGHWVHRLSIDDDELAIVNSRLLSLRPDANIVLTTAAGDRLKVADRASVSSAQVYDLQMSQPSAALLPIDSRLMTVDWQSILGLALDRNGEISPISP